MILLITAGSCQCIILIIRNLSYGTCRLFLDSGIRVPVVRLPDGMQWYAVRRIADSVFRHAGFGGICLDGSFNLTPMHLPGLVLLPGGRGSAQKIFPQKQKNRRLLHMPAIGW